MLKLIAQNKYKLMAFIILLYVAVDVLQHKGQARVLFPKAFPSYNPAAGKPQSKSYLANPGKNWKKAINSVALVNALGNAVAGFECDVYFDTARNIFDVHHDPDNSTGLDLKILLEHYRQKKMTSGIWLDIKNLNESTAKPALSSLIELRREFDLRDKLLAESGRADLLTAFSDSGFYTSYYTPMFNPYQITDKEIKSWVDSIASVLKNSKVNALSGYYFQSSFLHNYFPDYPVLLWAANDRFSLVNWLFKRTISLRKEIFIALYP